LGGRGPESRSGSGAAARIFLPRSSSIAAPGEGHVCFGDSECAGSELLRACPIDVDSRGALRAEASPLIGGPGRRRPGVRTLTPVLATVALEVRLSEASRCPTAGLRRIGRLRRECGLCTGRGRDERSRCRDRRRYRGCAEDDDHSDECCPGKGRSEHGLFLLASPPSVERGTRWFDRVARRAGRPEQTLLLRVRPRQETGSVATAWGATLPSAGRQETRSRTASAIDLPVVPGKAVSIGKHLERRCWNG
jgi:hypothetical protein